MSTPSQRARPGRAILLVNLGSPDSTAVSDVRRYLGEFLMDGRVIDVPGPLRALIVRGFILPFRPKKSAHAYGSIWTPEGSPLIVLSRRLRDLLQAKVEDPVYLAMRYGRPSIPDVLREILRLDRGGGRIDEIFLVPLYPHYAMASYETVVVRVREELARIAPQVSLRVRQPFYDDPRYIEALHASAREALGWPHDHLLLSYHGIPVRQLRKTDPTGSHCYSGASCCETPSPAHATCYRMHVRRTSEAFARRAGLADGRWSLAFQSRLGSDTWLEPSTVNELDRLAAAGVKRLLVMSPAFVSDCLETLEELGMRAKEQFEAASGGEFRLVPCLNDEPLWVEALAAWCREGEPS